MDKLESKNLSQRAAELIEEKIIRMELKNGERLLEAKLAGTLGVSQGTIREALRLLEKKGLVSISSRRGTVVTELDYDYVISMYDILTELYGLLARKAMERYTSDNVQAIFSIFDSIEQAAANNDVDAYFNGIFDFASVALSITRDELLEGIIMSLWPNKRRIEYETLVQRKKMLGVNVKYFQLLRESMIRQDADAVAGLMKEYMQNEKKSALALFNRTESSDAKKKY